MHFDMLIYRIRLILTEKKLILIVYIAQTMPIVVKDPQTQIIFIHLTNTFTTNKCNRQYVNYNG